MASLARIEELADLIGKSDPKVGKKVRRLVENAKLFPESSDSVLRLLQTMCKGKGIDLSDEPCFATPDELPREGTELGAVLRGDKPVGAYKHPHTDLPGNQGVFGITGCGKSTLVGHQCEGWIEDGLCVIIGDQADEYRHLVNRFPPEKLLVLSARNFPLAPFENPVGSCLSDLSWLSQVVGVFREIFYLRDGSCNLLLKIVGDIYRERKVMEGSRDFPLLSEVFTELTRRKFSIQSRHAGFLETLVNRFHGLLQSFPGMNAKRSLVPAQVLQHSLIIRMSDLNPGEMDTFVSLFLIWLMAVLQENICNESRVVLVLEEAHNIASRDKMRMGRYDLGDPISVRILRTGRKHGICVVVIDQTPSELAPAVLGNVSTRIVFRLTNSPCINAIAYSMGLDRTQAEKLAEMPLRRAVVQTARIPKPFLLNVLEIPERQRPSAEELKERETLSLEVLDHELSGVDVTEVLLGREKKKEEPPQIRGDVYRVHARVCERPYERIEERVAGLEIDRAREFRARATLEKLGMIEPGDKVGTKWQLFIPTAKGADYARKLGLPVYVYKSGVGHEMMLRKVREALGKFSTRVSFISESEGLGEVCRVQPDLLVRIRASDGDTSRRVAIQINCTNRAEYEVRRALELCEVSQIDMVIVIAKNKRAKEALERKLEELRTIQTGASGGKSPDKELPNKESPDKESADKNAFARDRVKIEDFETCVGAAYNWSWVIG
jgi:hypothetical protein